jgi:thiol-disulfide isomerase/thioredoxin
MKQLLLFLVFLVGFTTASNAQLARGVKLESNIVMTDIKGKTIDVFAELADGKTVIIDVFATWCSPCWGFHQSQWLENMHEQYGEPGTDQIVVVGLEADASTTNADLFGTGGSTVGNWTEGVKYSLVEDASHNSKLAIAYFPTIYIIRPDKTVFEVNNFRYNRPIWEAVMFPKGPKDVFISTPINSKTFCNTSVFAQKPTIFNMGTTDISTVDVDFIVNGVSKLSTVNKVLKVFESTDVPLGNLPINATTEIEFKIDGVDGVVDVDNSSVKGIFLKPILNKKDFTIRFTTDIYPGEVSWVLKDNKNRTIANAAYETGPGQNGSGGDDANKTFEYEVNIATTTDVNCLTLTISDAFGDGLTGWTAGKDPEPGVEFVDINGNVFKPVMASDWNFGNGGSGPITNRVFTSFDLNASSLEDQPFVEALNIYPNPAADVLNIDMKIKDGTDYEVFVSDLMGKTLMKVANNSTYISVADFTSGVYFLNVRTKEGTFAQKFTKI